MHYLIYKITNNLDNKFYVGKHKTNNKNDDYFGSGLLLERAIEKHGKENFVKEIILELSTGEEMNQKEIDIVDEEFIARDDTYNIMLGGQGGWGYVNKYELNKTPEAKEAHRKNVKPEIATSRFKWLMENDDGFRLETVKKIKNAALVYRMSGKNGFKGKSHSVDTKKKMSDAKRGMFDGSKNPSYGKHWITNGIENKLVKKENVPGGWKKGRM
jgi:Sec7-like guanine-nucleotide exchange factor